MDSFIVNFWARIFDFLRWLSPFQLITTILPKRFSTHGFVDIWVLGNVALSVVTLFVSAQFPCSLITSILILYAVVRVFEVLVYQTNILFFDAYRQPQSKETYFLRSYRRIVILSLHNYAEIVFWFAAIYSSWRHLFGANSGKIGSFFGALYYSIVTMTTLGYGDIVPDDDFGRFVVTLHLAVAIFMTVVILARLVSYLPVPKTMDKDEKE